MLQKMFPKEINNDYNGSRIAIYVFVLITIMTIVRSLIHMFAPDGGVQSIATIPLDGYTSAGAATVILIFALWGLSQLLLGFIYVIVLWRYRALIPFMYLLLIIEYLMRIVLGILKPIVLMGTAPGGQANFIIVPLAFVMLILSLKSRKTNT